MRRFFGEKQVTLSSRYLFITPTLRGVLDDYSYVNPTMSNRVLERFARVVEMPQVRFYTKVELKSGNSEFGYAKATTGKAINFMVAEKSTVWRAFGDSDDVRAENSSFVSIMPRLILPHLRTSF